MRSGYILLSLLLVSVLDLGGATFIIGTSAGVATAAAVALGAAALIGVGVLGVGAIAASRRGRRGGRRFGRRRYR